MFTPRKIADNYREIISSIGFYPSMMSIGFLLFAVLSMSIEYTDIVQEIKKFLAVVLVDSEENARTILS
ncbi:hypothetical protein LCGC14_2530780, partial [marine sediment metagenome]